MLLFPEADREAGGEGIERRGVADRTRGLLKFGRRGRGRGGRPFWTCHHYHHHRHQRMRSRSLFTAARLLRPSLPALPTQTPRPTLRSIFSTASPAMSVVEQSPSGESPFKKQRLDEPVAVEQQQPQPAAQASTSEQPIAGPSTTTAAPEPPLPNGTRPGKQLPPELQSSYDPASFPSELPKSTSLLNYRQGLFLAPMVRIGALPTRLLSLEYGADLVWGPEIIDRALMGSERVVDPQTKAVHFMKDGKSVFSTHPIERPYVVFQLGCATPAWAYEAVKLVTQHDDVAGVDLNCGCPKNFSTTGGMGAGLLPRPDLLCDILRAMRRAAPPHVAVTCKIRLLPTEEATRALVRQIVRTGAIDAITIHCRTKEMRPREPALLNRINEVVETVREETGGKMPVCHNGDAWGWKEAQVIMKDSNVTSSMLARGPEKNPSCFREGPMACIVDEIVPKWLKYAVMLDNHVGNTKYCLNVLDWNSSNGNRTESGGALRRAEITKTKEGVQRAKTNEEMCAVERYKERIDVKKCKEEWEEYVMGDLARVLEERQKRRAGGKGAVVGSSTAGASEGVVAGKGEENEAAEVAKKEQEEPAAAQPAGSAQTSA